MLQIQQAHKLSNGIQIQITAKSGTQQITDCVATKKMTNPADTAGRLTSIYVHASLASITSLR